MQPFVQVEQPYSRTSYRPHWGILLSLFFFLAACGSRPNAEIIIRACLDQHGNPLPEGVTVRVAGVSQTWQGEPLTFPVQVKGEVGLVPVDVVASDGYEPVSKPQYDVQQGTTREVTLRFYKPYIVTVAALGREAAQIPGVTVYANNQQIGTTDEAGRLVWQIDPNSLDAGPVRPGTRLALWLERDGERVAAAPVIITDSLFAYNTAGQLDQAGPLPFLTNLEPAQAGPRKPEPSLLTPPGQPIVDLKITSPTATPTNPKQSDPDQPVPDISPPADKPAPMTLVQQADRAFAAGRITDAMRLYQEVPPDDRKAYKHALQRIGQYQFQNRNYEGAIRAFEQILNTDPSEYAAHNNLAAVYLATKSYDRALDHLNRVLALKHLIPKNRRREAELEVRATRAHIFYTQFQSERDPVTKREQGLLTMGVLQAFIDQIPPGDPAFADKRQEMQNRLEEIRQWIKRS